MRRVRQLLRAIRELFETISPILVSLTRRSVTIGISKRFFIFKLLKRLTRLIEQDPDLNFISVLKHYKVLGKFLHGELADYYRDRHQSYFKTFFINPEIYRAVRDDLEWVYQRNPDIKITITKRGVIIYDNYQPNKFNILLLTIHSGKVVPSDIEAKQNLTVSQREIIEDTDIHHIYSPLMLENNGIWIDTKLSRFACDYNRPAHHAIYGDATEPWIEQFWRTPLSQIQRKQLMDGYHEFYFTLAQLIDSYRFNLIFDGHSMKADANRPGISFGTNFIPHFYMPVVRSMQRKLRQLGYDEVVFNQPFGGGYILEWLRRRSPDVFTFSMEVNKKLYMNAQQTDVVEAKINKLSADISQIFEIIDDED